jgi:PASTA domain
MNIRIALVAVLTIAVAGCGAPKASVSSAPAARNGPAASVSSAPAKAPAKATSAKMPNVVGLNGGIAQDKLTKLGLTNVQFGSADPNASLVLDVDNWTVVSQSTKSGVKINDGDLIVLTAKKIGD